MSQGSLLMFVVVAMHMFQAHVCVRGVGFQDALPVEALTSTPENMPRAKERHVRGSQYPLSYKYGGMHKGTH